MDSPQQPTHRRQEDRLWFQSYLTRAGIQTELEFTRLQRDSVLVQIVEVERARLRYRNEIVRLRRIVEGVR